MCGITGIWSLSSGGDDLSNRIRRMAAALAHRGPDAEGIWLDDACSLALGHRRLSVFDLSEAGSQPMISADGSTVMVYNGEIYNFLELRSELNARGVHFKSRSDSEVLLEMIVRDGIAATLPRLEGMFAFAIWNRRQRRLTLARDAFGKKPLLYEIGEDRLRFASELGGFLADRQGTAPRLDETAAHLMLSFGVVPEPMSILEGVRKLPAGHAMEVSQGDGGKLVHRTWKWADPVTEHAPLPENPLEAFEKVFASAVSLRLAADVPVGVFLSGGVDSSLVAAEAQSQSGENIRTFTIGFDVDGYDESSHAAAVAGYLGTEHHLLRLPAKNMEESCLAASSWFDEPFADTSAIPTRILSEFARQKVTVALTGDGGDETFLGYPLHIRNAFAVSLLDKASRPLRQGFVSAMRHLPGRRAAWWVRALSHEGPGGFYLSQRSGGFFPDPAKLEPIMDRLPSLQGRRSDAEWLGGCDLHTYLIDDMLTKVDRASMSVGLEARSPLLDRRVVTLARALPLKSKVAGGKGKVLLRQALARRLPAELFERRKSGFRAPIGDWLNRPLLQDWSREHAERFDARFGWRTLAGLDARSLWQKNRVAPVEHGRELWRVCQLMDWSERHGV